MVMVSGGCTKSDEDRARERLRESGETLRRDAKKLGREAEAEAHAAGRKLDEKLHETREKAREKMDSADRGNTAPDDRRR